MKRAFVFLLLAFAVTSRAQDHLRVVLGVDDDGHATLLWQQIVQKHSPETFREVESVAKPFTPAELAWVHLIQSHQQRWENEVPTLALPFRPVVAPDARIVLGNRGGDDAFTHDPHTNCFDLNRIQSLYGDANSNDNPVRIDHFFRHEYTHLLQKAWLRDHPQSLDTPLQLALADIWSEGMGNYYSLLSEWDPAGGRPSPKTVETLRLLEPRFLTRLAAIACAAPEQARKLSKDLSSGPFDRKWGALPVALWLKSESGNPEFMRDFVLGGKESVWELATRHLSAAQKRQLDEIRAQETTCRVTEGARRN